MKNVLVILILATLLIESCAVQKRHYRNGYDVTFKTSKKNSNKKNEVTSLHRIETRQTVVEPTIQKNHELMASTDQDLSSLVLSSSHVNKQIDEPCDVLYFRNSKVVSAKVVEISSTNITYKRCDNLDGPLIVVDKNSVKSILYKNGDTETFTESYPTKPIQENQTSNKTSPKGDAKYDGFAIASFVCGLLFMLVIPVPLAIVFGAISLTRIKASEGKLVGKVFALIGFIIGCSIIIILTGIIISALLLL